MNVAILGSTGSIGKNVIEVCKHHGYKVTALSCNSNIDLLMEQYRELKPKILAVKDKKAYETLKKRLILEPVTILNKGGGIQICRHAQYDVIVNAIVGFAGLMASAEAASCGKRLAIANKESLVVYGESIMHIARENGTEILPIDSEHSAIFQTLQGNKKDEIEKIILTASGGPFREFTRDEIASKTAEEAIKHPRRHWLSQAVGFPEYLQIDFLHLDSQSGDRYLLCSDGLYNSMGESLPESADCDEGKSLLRETLASSRTVAEICDYLIDQSIAAEASDNVTAIVVFV